MTHTLQSSLFYSTGDPLLKAIDTQVVSASISKPPATPTASGKKSQKKSVLAPTLPNGSPVLEVLLHDTVIFPEGGGQPTDTGIIRVNGEETEWRVLQCKRHGGHAVHYVQVPQGLITAQQALEGIFIPGKNVSVELGNEGWERRYDHASVIQPIQHLSHHRMYHGLTLSIDVDAYFSARSICAPRIET